MEANQSKMLWVTLLFPLMFLLPLFTESINVVYCDKKANYDVKVSGVEISPYPITRGVNTTFTVAALTDKAISGGNLVIDVIYFFFKVYGETHDLCEKITCPISTGAFEFSHTEVLPGITPPGSYSLKMRMLDDQKHELACFTFDFGIWLGESEAVTDS